MTSHAKARLTKDIKETREELNHILEAKKQGSKYYLGDPIDMMIFEVRKDLMECRRIRALMEYGQPAFIDRGEEIQVNWNIHGTGIYLDTIEGVDVFLILGRSQFHINLLESAFGSWAEEKKLNVVDYQVRRGFDDHDDKMRIIDVKDWIRDNADNFAEEWLADLFKDEDDVTAHLRILERHAKKIKI